MGYVLLLIFPGVLSKSKHTVKCSFWVLRLLLFGFKNSFTGTQAESPAIFKLSSVYRSFSKAKFTPNSVHSFLNLNFYRNMFFPPKNTTIFGVLKDAPNSDSGCTSQPSERHHGVPKVPTLRCSERCGCGMRKKAKIDGFLQNMSSSYYHYSNILLIKIDMFLQVYEFVWYGSQINGLKYVVSVLWKKYFCATYLIDSQVNTIDKRCSWWTGSTWHTWI